MLIGFIIFLVCVFSVLPGLNRDRKSIDKYQNNYKLTTQQNHPLKDSRQKVEEERHDEGVQPDTYIDLFQTIKTKEKSRTQTKIEFKQIRQSYVIPDIETPTQVNCAAMLDGDASELKKAAKIVDDVWKVPIYEETYEKWFADCDDFKLKRGYVQIPLTEEEENFPLAFSIAMFQDIESTERLLRAIYQPQNIYCIHIDTKSTLLLHRAVYGLANCFDNVFIASHLDKIKWGDISVILPDINCMNDFARYHRGKYKYYINLTGQEMVLRTNWELVQIAKIFNGSNDMGGSIKK